MCSKNTANNEIGYPLHHLILRHILSVTFCIITVAQIIKIFIEIQRIRINY